MFSSRYMLALLVALFVFPSAAQAVTLVNPDGSVAQPYQAWADAAKVPTPDDDGATEVRSDDWFYWCDGRFGCWYYMQLWMDPVIDETHRAVFMHELGHIFDTWNMDGFRRQYCKLAGHRCGRWEVAAEGQISTAEYFADSYRFCADYGDFRTYLTARRSGQIDLTTTYGILPSGKTFNRICAVIRRAGNYNFD